MNQKFDFYDDDLADLYIEEFEGDFLYSSLETNSLSTTQDAPGPLESNDGGKSSSPNHHGNEQVDHVCPHPQTNPHQQWENSVTMWQSQAVLNSKTMAQSDERNIWGPVTAQNTEASNLSWSQSAAHLSDLAAGAWSAPAKGVMGETAFRVHDQTGHMTNPLDRTHIPGGQAAAQSPGFVYQTKGGAEAALTKNAHRPGTTLTESLVHSQHAFQSAAPANSNTWPDDMKQALPTQHTSANTVDDSQITPLLPDLLGNPAESEMHGDVHNEGADGTSVDSSLGSDKLDLGQLWLMVQTSCLSKHPVPTVECDGETSAKITEAQQSLFCPSLERRQCEEKPHGRLESKALEPDSTPLDELFGSLNLLENEDAVSVAAGQWDKQASQTRGSSVRRDLVKLMSSQQPHQSLSTDIQNVPGQWCDPPAGPLRHQELELEGCTDDELVPESKQKGMQTHCRTVMNSRLNWPPPPGLPQPQTSDEAGMKGAVDHTKRLKESLPKKEFHHPISHAAAAPFHSAASLPPENVGVAWHASSPKPSCSLEERVVERDNLLPVSGQHVRRNDVRANLKPAETQRAGTERAGKGATRAREEEITAAQARAGSNNVFADCFSSAMARDLSSFGSPRPADLTSNGTADSGGQSDSGRENPRMSLNPGVPDVRPKGSAGTVALTVDTGGPMPDTCVATPGSQYRGTTTSPAESSAATSRHLSRDATSLSVSQRNSPSLSQFMGDYSLPPLPMQNQTWTEVDINKDLFEPTAAWEDALDLLDSSQHRVLLSGMPGSGKRTLARALLRRYESKGILCHVIKTSQEWRDNVGGQELAILLLDQIFGQGILQRDLLDVWRQLFDIMVQFCKQGKVMLVFTFCPHVLRALREAEPNCELFSTLCEVRMQNLDEDEKKKMVDRHLQHKEPLMLLAEEEGQFSVYDVKMRILKIDDSGEMFPRCCEKFVTTIVSYTPRDDPSEDKLNRACFLEDSLKIFSRPSPVYKDFILQLLNEEEALKEKLIAAFSLLLENVNLADVGSAEVVAKRCRELGFSLTCSRVSLHEILMKFSSYLVTEDCRQFINRHAYEGTALALAQRHASVVLQVVDWQFVSKRCIVSHRSAPIRDTLKPHVLEIKMSETNPRPEYKALVNRFAQGLQNPDKVVLALQNDALGFQLFVREGLEPVYLRQGDEVLLKILSGTQDSIHKVSLLYWSLLNSSGCMAEWIFKTVHKKKGRHRKTDLVLSAYACCMFTGKSRLLGMFLRYWKQVTSEDPKELLRGSHLESGSVTVPLPEKSVIFSNEWKKQCKHLHKISGKVPRNGIKISQPPLHLAVLYDNIEVVDLLAKKYPDLLGVTDPHSGGTALHVAARHGRLEILWRLLEHRGGSVSVAAMDNFEDSPLHQACSAGQVDAARLLMAAGPELANVRNRSGCFPVDLALAGNHHDIVQLLHEKPAYISKQ